MANQGIFSGGVRIRSLNGYLIAVNGEVFATTNTGGTTNAFFYQAKTTITSGDPGSGHLIWNNATQISATQLNVSHLTDTPVEDIDLFLSAIASGNKLVVQDRNDSANYQSWTVTGTPTQIGSSYWTIPVSLIESQGTGTTGFANNHDLLFAIITGGTGGGGITTNAVTFNNSGSGAASGTSFNGATPVTVSYNTFGAQQASASLTALAGLTYASGTPFVKMTGAGTFALDTNIYLTANQTITLSGDVTGSGATAITTTIANNAVTLAKMAQVATARFLGRVTAGTGNVEALTGTQATTLLDTFTSALKGLAPASGGGTTNFLRADGTWAAPPGGSGTPAGSNTQIQYNNSGAFGASNKLTWNESTRVLNVGDGSADSAIEIYSRNVSNGWAGRFLGDYVTGQFYIQHRNNSATWQTCLFFNGNTNGQTYMVDKAYVVGLGILMVNTGVDNGVDKLQVNGSMSVGSIKSSGNVGIFNSSPFYALSVGDGTSTRQVVINGLNSGTAGGSSIAVQTNSSTTIMFGNKSNVIGGAYDGQPLFGYGGSTNSLQFYNFNTLAVTAMISSGDRFLIGTTTDNNTDKLQVNGSVISTSGYKITSGTSSQYLKADGTTQQITSGTASPTGGNDGDIYLQYDVSLLTGSGTANYIPKFTSSTAIGNSQIFDNGTSVGIGTTSPATDLQISRAGSSTFRLTNTSNTTNVELGIATALGFVGTNTDNSFAINTNNTERVRVTNTGNVGIGETSPNGKLDVRSATGHVGINTGTSVSPERGNLYYTTDGTGWNFNIGKLQSGTFTPQMTFQDNGNVGIGTTSPAYPLQVRRAGGAGSLGISIDAVGNTDRAVQYFSIQDNAAGAGAGHAFYYRTPNSTTDVLGYILDEAGNVGIGTASPATKFVVSNAGASGLEINPTGGVSSGVLLQAYNRSTSAYMAQSYYALGHTFNVGTAAATRALDISSAGNTLVGTAVDNGVDRLQVSGNVTATQYSATVQTLTDGATITFNAANGSNAVVTLGGNRTLAFSNTRTGAYYTLRVIQDGTGSRTLTMPGTVKVIGGGGGVVNLTTTANAVDIISFYFDGTTYWASFGQNYT